MTESFAKLMENLRTLGPDLSLLLPELALVVAIVWGLLSRCFRLFSQIHAYWLGLPLMLVGLVVLGIEIADPTTPTLAFGGQLRIDTFAQVCRFLILAFATCTLLMSLTTRLPDCHDSADVMTLILGSTLGLMILVSANTLLTMFLGLEMGSLPGYALVGLMKGQRRGSESALKYLLYGSAASAVALFGISLITLTMGSTAFESLGPWLGGFALANHYDLAALLGLVFLFVGLGFKLSVVPMHFWTPDVFEGAPAEVAAFLSAASKAAAAAIMLRLLMTVQAHLAGSDAGWLQRNIGMVLMILAAMTTTFGNLAALGQQNLKRMLAYSTIAHAGFLLAGLALCNERGATAVLYYLAAYLPATMIAFLIVADLRVRKGSETITDLHGLFRSHPWSAIALGFCVLSLLGLPPLGGFAGKFQVLLAYFDNRDAGPSELRTATMITLVLLVVNTVVSAGYYLKLLKAAFLDGSEEMQAGSTTSRSFLRDALLGVAVALLIIIGLFWNPINTLSERAVRSLSIPLSPNLR
jgi:NADH-quinone oxidoreductase subunit N